jgi:hypothetical protein
MIKFAVYQDGTKSQNIYDIPIDTFIKITQKNITEYHYLNMFWMPVIEKRAKLHHDFAEDLLLNPIFRWSYIGTKERLTALERELKDLNYVLGQDAFENYQKIIMDYMAHQKIENLAHDRMFDARAEIRGMLYYDKLGYSIILEPIQSNKKSYDFNATSNNSNIAVEAKFIRHPDKLGIYLMRWWQAQGEVSGIRPLGYFPYIKFKWTELNRDDLSSGEIEIIKKFFRSVFEEPSFKRELSDGRINIRYSKDNKLPLVTTPLGAIEDGVIHPVVPLIRKIQNIVEKAKRKQLANPKAQGRKIACYLLLSLKSDIRFSHEKAFNDKLAKLKSEWARCGLEFITEEVPYL